MQKNWGYWTRTSERKALRYSGSITGLQKGGVVPLLLYPGFHGSGVRHSPLLFQALSAICYQLPVRHTFGLNLSRTYRHYWLGMLGSNQRARVNLLTGSKPVALPLGESPLLAVEWHRHALFQLVWSCRSHGPCCGLLRIAPYLAR